MAEFNKNKYVPLWFMTQIGDKRFIEGLRGKLRIGNFFIRNTTEKGEIAIEDTKTTMVVKMSLIDFENAINELMESTWKKLRKKG
jgi:hypothetical protein